jgi:hypothetical protein
MNPRDIALEEALSYKRTLEMEFNTQATKQRVLMILDYGQRVLRPCWTIEYVGTRHSEGHDYLCFNLKQLGQVRYSLVYRDRDLDEDDLYRITKITQAEPPLDERLCDAFSYERQRLTKLPEYEKKEELDVYEEKDKRQKRIPFVPGNAAYEQKLKKQREERQEEEERINRAIHEAHLLEELKRHRKEKAKADLKAEAEENAKLDAEIRKAKQFYGYAKIYFEQCQELDKSMGRSEEMGLARQAMFEAESALSDCVDTTSIKKVVMFVKQAEIAAERVREILAKMKQKDRAIIDAEINKLGWILSTTKQYVDECRELASTHDVNIEDQVFLGRNALLAVEAALLSCRKATTSSIAIDFVSEAHMACEEARTALYTAHGIIDEAKRKREQDAAAQQKREQDAAAQRKRELDAAAQRKREQDAVAQRKREQDAQRKREFEDDIEQKTQERLKEMKAQEELLRKAKDLPDITAQQLYDILGLGKVPVNQTRESINLLINRYRKQFEHPVMKDKEIDIDTVKNQGILRGLISADRLIINGQAIPENPVELERYSKIVLAIIREIQKYKGESYISLGVRARRRKRERSKRSKRNKKSKRSSNRKGI